MYFIDYFPACIMKWILYVLLQGCVLMPCMYYCPLYSIALYYFPVHIIALTCGVYHILYGNLCTCLAWLFGFFLIYLFHFFFDIKPVGFLRVLLTYSFLIWQDTTNKWGLTMFMFYIIGTVFNRGLQVQTLNRATTPQKRTEPFSARNEPYRSWNEPYRARSVPYRSRNEPYRSWNEPFRARSVPYRARSVPYRSRSEPKRSWIFLN